MSQNIDTIPAVYLSEGTLKDDIVVLLLTLRQVYEDDAMPRMIDESNPDEKTEAIDAVLEKLGHRKEDSDLADE